MFTVWMFASDTAMLKIEVSSSGLILSRFAASVSSGCVSRKSSSPRTPVFEPILAATLSSAPATERWLGVKPSVPLSAAKLPCMASRMMLSV